MGGVYMKAIVKRLIFLVVLVCCFYTGAVLADKNMLHDELIGLYVVSASDSIDDRMIHLEVRDAVIESLQQAVADATDMSQAKKYIQDHLPQIEAAANAVLRRLGSVEQARVSFVGEAFPIRIYDAISLPSEAYGSLRVNIGQGKNRWSVLFPSLCFRAASSVAGDVTAGAGLSEEQSSAIDQQEDYQIRFFFLDMLRRIENFFFGD